MIVDATVYKDGIGYSCKVTRFSLSITGVVMVAFEMPIDVYKSIPGLEDYQCEDHIKTVAQMCYPNSIDLINAPETIEVLREPLSISAPLPLKAIYITMKTSDIEWYSDIPEYLRRGRG